MRGCLRWVLLWCGILHSFSGLCQDTTRANDSSVYVRRVLLAGNKKTKDYLLLREIPLRAGQRLSRAEADAQCKLGKDQLMNTTLFVTTDLRLIPVQGDTVDALAMVRERWYLFPVPYFDIVDRSFNEWLVTHNATLKRVNYGLKLKWYNVSGRNDKLDFAAINGYNQELSFGYSQPFADNSLRHGFEVGFRYGRQHEMNFGTLNNKPQFLRLEDEYVRTGARITLGYSYRPGSRHRHYVRLHYVWDQVFDSVLKLNPDFNGLQRRSISFPEASYYWEYYGVDYNPYPQKGIIASAGIHLRGLHKDMSLTQLSTSILWARPLPHKFNLLLQGNAIVKLPFEQPFYNQPLYNYGGPFVRGTEYYVIDGVAGIIGRATLRRKLLGFEVKSPLKRKDGTRSRIPFAFYGKVYGDAAYAYQPMSTNYRLNNKLIRSGGFGLDIVSFYDVVVRLEYSYNQLGEHGLFIHDKSQW